MTKMAKVNAFEGGGLLGTSAEGAVERENQKEELRNKRLTRVGQLVCSSHYFLLPPSPTHPELSPFLTPRACTQPSPHAALSLLVWLPRHAPFSRNEGGGARSPRARARSRRRRSSIGHPGRQEKSNVSPTPSCSASRRAAAARGPSRGPYFAAVHQKHRDRPPRGGRGAFREARGRIRGGGGDDRSKGGSTS